MSSDTFYVHIQSIQGTTVELACRTSTAGGLNDYAVTRSFALMAIEDCMPSTYAGSMTPLQARLRELAGGDTPPVWEASFHRDHVGTFIASTELVSRSGIITDWAAWQSGRFDGTNPDTERLYPLHAFVLRVKMTDPRWLEGLVVGARAGTTAFDAWWDDPKRPSQARLAAVERDASRWRPPTATAKKSAAKKSASKKSASKKATSKQSAARRAPGTTSAAKKSASKATPNGATSRKSAAKKSASKKATSTKSAAKKTTAKKSAAKKSAAKKTTAKKSAAKETTAKKTTAKKSAAKKSAAKKTTAKKSAAKKSASKKSAAKKAPARTSSARKTPARSS